MTSDPTNGFRFPALVSLAPKLRCKSGAAGQAEANEALTLATFAPKRQKIRRSGHLSVQFLGH